MKWKLSTGACTLRIQSVSYLSFMSVAAQPHYWTHRIHLLGDSANLYSRTSVEQCEPNSRHIDLSDAMLTTLMRWKSFTRMSHGYKGVYVLYYMVYHRTINSYVCMTYMCVCVNVCIKTSQNNPRFAAFDCKMMEYEHFMKEDWYLFSCSNWSELKS